MKSYFISSSKPSAIWLASLKLDERIDVNPYKIEHIENENILDSNIKIISISEGLRSQKDLTGGATPLGANYLKKGIKFIRTQNVQRNTIDLSDVVYISDADNEKLTRSKLEEDDILLTITGADFGRIAPVRKSHLPANINQHSVRLHFKDNINSYFISTYLNSKFGQSQIFKYSIGVTRPAIDYSAIRKIKIPIPSSEIQEYIGNKVRRAEGLREEAKKQRKKAESFINGKIGILKVNDDSQYSSAFISSFKIIDRIDSEYYNTKYLRIENEFDKIGYETKTLNELCNRILNGKTYSTTNVEGKYFNIGVGELGDWFIKKKNEKFINDTINKRYCLNKNSIVWGNAAHLAKYIGEKVNMIFEDDIVIPTTEVTAIEPNEEVIDPYYLYLFMRSKWGYYQIQRTVKGMTAHSYPQDIGKILVPIINLTNEEKEELKDNVVRSYNNEVLAQQLIQEAKQDVEDLIEGNFDMSKLSDTTPESR